MKSILILILFGLPMSNLAQNADAYFKRGVVKAKLEDYKGAIQDFIKAIELDPNLFNYNNRGLKSSLKDYRGTIQDYSKTIEISPRDTDAYFYRGKAKARIENFRGAIQDFSKAIEISPRDADAYHARGLAKIDSRDKNAGCLDLSKAGELGLDVYDEIKKHCN